MALISRVKVNTPLDDALVWKFPSGDLNLCCRPQRAFRRIKTIIAIFFAGTAAVLIEAPENCYAGSTQQDSRTNTALVGYARPKKPVFGTQKLPSVFKPLRHGGVYQSLDRTPDGLIIICDLVDGQQAVACMPFKDSMGYAISIEEHSGGEVVLRHPILDRFDQLKLKPAPVPLEMGHRYEVVDHTTGACTLISTYGGLTQRAEVASADVDFVSLADYRKAIEDEVNRLRKEADQNIADFSPSNNPADLFRQYSGKFAEDTVRVRKQLAYEYEKKWVARGTESGFVQYRGQWVTPEVKANLENGLVEYDGAWMTTDEKYRREQMAKGLVEYQGRWMTPEVKANLEKGLIEYNGMWVTAEQKEKLEAELNLTNLKTAVAQGDYAYASQFVGNQYPLPPIEQKLRSWVEKAGALQQASSEVESTKRLAAQESARIQDAQTPKYETYYTDENVTFTCTWCKGSGVSYEGVIMNPGDRFTPRTCPVCGGSGQLTRRIPVKKRRELQQEPVSMDRLNALEKELRKYEAQVGVAVQEEQASRNALVGLLSDVDHPPTVSQTRATPSVQYPATSQSPAAGARGVSQTTATSSTGSEGREGLRKRLNTVNERMVEIFAALQQSASIPTGQLMENAMNGGKAYTDRYNARNEALKREWDTLEKEKADLERRLAALPSARE